MALIMWHVAIYLPLNVVINKRWGENCQLEIGLPYHLCLKEFFYESQNHFFFMTFPTDKKSPLPCYSWNLFWRPEHSFVFPWNTKIYEISLSRRMKNLALSLIIDEDRRHEMEKQKNKKSLLAAPPACFMI